MLREKLVKLLSNICILITCIAICVLGTLPFYPIYSNIQSTKTYQPIFLEGIPGCITTKCLDASTADLCSKFSEKYQTDFKNVIQNKCTITEDENITTKAGLVAVCCQPRSFGDTLVSATRAEDAEFPHQVAFKSDLGLCGGTIYNPRYIITSAHCLVNGTTGQIINTTSITIVTGTNFWQFAPAPEYVYKALTVIPHPEFSELATNRRRQERDDEKRMLINDIALVELDRNIVFSGTVKALQIAPNNFNPSQYAESVLVIGWGNSDTLRETTWLQKSNFMLRSDERCLQLDKQDLFSEFSERLLCLGGFLDGKWSPVVGNGDGGSPAICRDENGRSVLCGVASFSTDDEKCQQSWAEEYCSSSVFTEVAYFHDWIENVAGPKDEATLINAHLYGQTVNMETHPYFVEIKNNDDKTPCVGLLIQTDIVLADATCVLYGNSTLKNVTVSSWTGKFFGIRIASSIRLFDGPTVKRMRRSLVNLAKQVQGLNVTDHFKSEMALIMLNGTVPIPMEQLVRLPKHNETFEKGTELSLGRNGDLISREIAIINRSDCEIRLYSLGMVIHGNHFCGVEVYSGGSTCDRGYGRELVCQGDDGQAVMCGISIFRLCMFSTPYVFADIVGPWTGRIEAVILEMRRRVE